jgi:pilus assembly protein Flp/PilA
MVGCRPFEFWNWADSPLGKTLPKIGWRLEMDKFRNFMTSLFKDTAAATAVEYGILVALIAVAIIITVALMGTALNDAFGSVQMCVGSAWSGNPVCS